MILDAMKNAIEESSKELELYLKKVEKEKMDDTTAVLIEASRIVHKKKSKSKK